MPVKTLWYHSPVRVLKVGALALGSLLLLASPAASQVPSPEAHFGFRLGTDRRLASADAIEQYFAAVAAKTDRVKMLDLGPTTEGHRMIAAAVSSAENIRNLERIRATNARLADPRTLEPDEARHLAATQKVILAIGASIHASEVGATQAASELLYSLVSASDASTLAVLDNVVTVIIPSLNPDGERLVSASLDGTARVWSTLGKNVAQVLRGHDGPVVAAKFSPDGDYIVTASHDKTVRVWNSHDGQPVARLRGDQDRILNLELSGDGAWAMTSDLTESIRIWDIRATMAEADFSAQTGNPTAATFSPDGLRVAIPTSGGPSNIGSVAVWSTTTTRKQFDLLGHTGDVWSAVFSNDGSHLVTASQDRYARIWDLATKQCLLLRHDEWVNWASFSPDDARVVTASGDRSARVWDAKNGRQILRLDHPDRVRCAVYSPVQQRIATACDDGAVYIWDAGSGSRIGTLLGHSGPITSVSFGRTGTRLASSSEDGTARVWDLETGQAVVTLVGHTKRVMSVSFSPDESRIVTASWDQSVRVWDTASGHEMAAFRDHRRDAAWATFSPDGTRLLTTYQGGAVLLRDRVLRADRFAATVGRTVGDTH